MAVEPEDRDVLRGAWDRLCDDLRTFGRRTIDELDDVDNQQELAEALRSVTRMVLMTLQQRIEFDDPDFPVFFRSLDDRFKYAGPDTYITYVTAPVQAGATYRIDIDHRGRDLQLGRFWSNDLVAGDDGSIEIVAGPAEEGVNWHPLDETAGRSRRVVPDLYPMVNGGFGGRIYFTDPDDDRPARLSIERTDHDRPRQPAPLSPQQLAEQLDSSRELLEVMTRWWFQRSSKIRAEHVPNVVGPPGTRPPGVPGFAVPDNSPLNYGVCCWELEPDDALVITTDIPDVDYWSFQLNTPWWEAPDNQHRITSINHHDAHLDADGRFRCVLAHRDPGIANWLDVGGNRRGFLFYRWLRPTSPMPTPVAVVTTIDRAREHLPVDHPTVDQASRDAQLGRRRRWYAARFQS